MLAQVARRGEAAQFRIASRRLVEIGEFCSAEARRFGILGIGARRREAILAPNRGLRGEATPASPRLESFASPRLASHRWHLCGGVARYVLQPGFTIEDPQKTDPIKEALNPGSVVQAIAESDKVDATNSSDVLVHLVPDESYRVYANEWGSTYIMQRSFEELFKVSRRQIETMLVSAEKLHVGIFYGILFEPWFHKWIAERGYTGRIRKLSTGRELTANKKRPFFGINKDIDPLQTQQYTIPRSTLNQFFYNKDIAQKAYNVPSEPNYPSVDSLYPSRGELFQVTSADRHPIKTDNLSTLRPYFSDYLSRNNKVKFIFVVPPHLFENSPFSHFMTLRDEDRKSGMRGNPEVVSRVPLREKNMSELNLR
jgi:hypothetical protein